MMMGATAEAPSGSPSAALPSASLSHRSAKPIQHDPSPLPWAASIRFSAARQQSSVDMGSAILLQITISSGAL